MNINRTHSIAYTFYMFLMLSHPCCAHLNLYCILYTYTIQTKQTNYIIELN